MAEPLSPFQSYLTGLLHRLRAGEEAAYHEAAEVFGPVFRTYFLNAGLDASGSERFAAHLIYDVLTKSETVVDPSIEWLASTLEAFLKEVIGDLARASELQGRLFKRLPELETWGICAAGAHRAARLVSGDFYDVQVTQSSVVAVLGDASGKGPAAALISSFVMGIISAELSSSRLHERSPATNLLKTINGVMMRRKSGQEYAHVTVAAFEPKEGIMTFATGGGPPPLLRANQCWTGIQVGGVPPGLISLDEEYASAARKVAAGDIIVLISDGVTDQANRAQQFYGAERLLALLNSRSDWNPERLVDSVFTSLDEFAGGVASQDDQSVLVLQIGS